MKEAEHPWALILEHGATRPLFTFFSEFNTFALFNRIGFHCGPLEFNALSHASASANGKVYQTAREEFLASPAWQDRERLIADLNDTTAKLAIARQDLADASTRLRKALESGKSSEPAERDCGKCEAEVNRLARREALLLDIIGKNAQPLADALHAKMEEARAAAHEKAWQEMRAAQSEFNTAVGPLLDRLWEASAMVAYFENTLGKRSPYLELPNPAPSSPAAAAAA